MFDFFFDIIKMDISSYFVNTAPDVVDLKPEDSVSLLEKNANKFSDWFSNSALQASSEKCHILSIELTVASDENFGDSLGMHL